MGLDMYLFREQKIKQEVGYWRKANAIHNWFVKNVQNGKDDQEEYEVTNKTLKKLKKDCKYVLDNLDKEWELDRDKMRMPPTEGFFFGDTNDKKYYKEDLKETIKLIDNVLKENKDLEEQGEEIKLYYTSWW